MSVAPPARRLAGALGLLAALSAGALSACAAPAYQPDPVWRQRVETLVDVWPDATYAVFADGEEVGTMTLSQGVERVRGEPLLLLEDAARITPADADEPLDYTFAVRCRLDEQFTPLDIESQAPSPDGPTFSRLELDDGRVYGTAFGAQVNLPTPPQVTVRQGLMRLVGLLPREEGSETELAFLSVGVPTRVDAPRVVRCVGPDSLALDGEAVPCWRFVYDSGADGATHPVEIWVGPDGRLLRFHDEEGLQLVIRQSSGADGF